MNKKRILKKTQVKSINKIADGVYILSFVRDFQFSAGQVIAIDIESNGIPRIYSIASGENDVLVDILFDEKPEGHLTPLLSNLKPGESIYISEPFGTFCSTIDKAFWIASGTGIAPFISMSRSGYAFNNTLIHGGKTDENFYFSELLQPIFQDKYIRCCSQQLDTQNYKGRLTEWLKSNESLDIDCNFMLCGSPEMVVEVRDILISKGVLFGNIISETYF